LLTKDEARRIAVNFAKLLDALEAAISARAWEPHPALHRYGN
jgi:hypothetical protein